MRDAVALRTLFNAFAQIFLQRHAGCGALVMLALALAAPALLAGALFGVLAAHAGAIWMGYRTADREAGLCGYNAALLGILLVDRLGLSSSSLALVALVALAALASCVQQARLLDRLRQHGALPGFTLPFVLIGLLALALLPLPPASLPTAMPPDAPGLFSAWLLGIGQVVFVDDPLAAACLLAAVALARPRDALWLLAGSALGLLLGVWLGAAWASGWPVSIRRSPHWPWRSGEVAGECRCWAWPSLRRSACSATAWACRR